MVLGTITPPNLIVPHTITKTECPNCFPRISRTRVGVSFGTITGVFAFFLWFCLVVKFCRRSIAPMKRERRFFN